MSTKAKLAPPQEGQWKAKSKNSDKPRMIPFSEMEDDHLQRAYFISQNKLLEHFNKSITFEELVSKLEQEAERRGLTLRSIEDEPSHKVGNFFKNNRKLRNSK